MIANVKSKWVDGDLVFVTAAGTEIARFDESAGTLDITALAIGGTAVTSTAAELNKLDGAGAVVASGTKASNIADAKTNYTTGDLDTEAEIIAAINTANGKINSLIAAIEAFNIASAT